MKPSHTRAEALDVFVDRLQRGASPTSASDLDLERGTAELAAELHQFARQAPRRPELFEDVERSLMSPTAPAVLSPFGRPRSTRRLADLAAGVLFIVAFAAVLAILVRESAPRRPAAPSSAAERLIGVFGRSDSAGAFQGSRLHALDPETLADAAGTTPLELGPCGAGPVQDPLGRQAVIALNGGFMGAPGCAPASTLDLGIVDVQSMSMIRQIRLETAPERAIELAWTPAGPPLIWSPDGLKFYAFTVSRPANPLDWITGGDSGGEIRQLWLVDPSTATPPNPIALEAAPWRMVFSPNGRSLYMLGYQTRGPSRWGYLQPGSTALLVLDPATGATRSRIALPEVKVAALPGMARPWYDPGVGVSSDGRHYFVAHPDKPIVDVVDIPAAKLERSVVTDTSGNAGNTTLASLDVSPDDRRLYVHRWSGFPTDGSMQPTHLIDVNAWNVSVFDSAALYIRVSPDGRWVYAIDAPRDPMPQGQMPDFKNAPGAGLRVLNTAGHLVARLMQDQLPFQVVQFDSNRLYVALPGADYVASPPFAVSREGQDFASLVAYEVGAWRPMARRTWPFPVYLSVSPGHS